MAKTKRTRGVEAALNEQMAKEFYAAHLYLSMAAYFDDRGLPGFAKWMLLQHQEEQNHAMRLYNYILQSGGRVLLQGVDQPPTDFDSPLGVMEQSLTHEQAVTKAIHDLYELAQQEKDYAAQLELQWFITEQLEEEKTFEDIIARMKLGGAEKGPGLLIIDSELGQRTTAA